MCLGVPGEVIEFSGGEPTYLVGRVRFGDITKEINLSFTPEAKVGDYVIVHVGFAISIIDEKEAVRMLETLKALNEVEVG